MSVYLLEVEQCVVQFNHRACRENSPLLSSLVLLNIFVRYVLSCSVTLVVVIFIAGDTTISGIIQVFTLI